MDDIDFEDIVAENSMNSRIDSEFLLDEVREKERIRRQINSCDRIIHDDKYFEDRGL